MFANQQKNYLTTAILWLVAVLGLVHFPAPNVVAREKSANKNPATFGIIRGIVRDEQGNAIKGAVVAILKNGTATILKQIQSAADGSFSTRMIAGTYRILAVAEGFNPVVLSDVEINRAAELNYGFKLERVGSGKTLPEKRADRDNSKWRIRAAQASRSIYQAQESQNKPKIIDQTAANVEQSIGVAKDEEGNRPNRRGQNLVETFVGNNGKSTYSGLNFATVQPINEKFEIAFAGQIASNKNAPQRLEISTKTVLNNKHQFRVSAAATSFGSVSSNAKDSKELGQVSVQALDEWKIREGVILVLGVDFSKFVGAGNASAFSPRFGLQFDVNSKTRFRAALTTSTEEKTWQKAAEIGEGDIIFKEFAPAENSVVFVDEKPQISKRRRMEFGIERVLDNRSSIEATAFFDNISSRGVGLTNLPLNLLSPTNAETFTASQNGSTQGLRVVYSRRMNSIFTASAGYALGRGQKLSPKGLQSPNELFENGFFQNAVFQLTADLNNGTRVKTIYRLSPSATVFAIDPFQGRLAIYDPSLSVLVTQSLPTFGLPVRAEATVDARNLFDFAIGVANQENTLKLSNGSRVLRGGISLRF